MKTNHQSGFTFIEVMIAMVMGSVAILLISTTLLTSQISLTRSRQRFIFFENTAAAAARVISQITDPHCQNQGVEESEETLFNWRITSKEGLLKMNIEGIQEAQKLNCEIEIWRSAWLQRMGDPHE